MKDVSVGGKAASKVYLDNRIIWQKTQPGPKYAVRYSENPTVINWLRTMYTFEDYTIGITMDEAQAITELPAATSALKSGLRTFDELQYFTGITSLGKRDDSSASTTSPFVGCSNLTSITLPDSCIALGRSCFDGCSKLSSVKNCKVKELYRSCFANCGALDLSTVDLSNVELIYGAYCLCYNTTSTTGIIDLSNLKQYNNVSSTATNAVGISNVSNVCSIRLPDYNQVNFITSKKFIYSGNDLTLYIKSGQKSRWNAKVSSGTNYITYVEE